MAIHHIPKKTRAPDHELRRRVSDAWHGYLATLHRGADADATSSRELDAMAEALDELRQATSDLIGII